jgi:hypothetical protein
MLFASWPLSFSACRERLFGQPRPAPSPGAPENAIKQCAGEILRFSRNSMSGAALTSNAANQSAPSFAQKMESDQSLMRLSAVLKNIDPRQA